MPKLLLLLACCACWVAFAAPPASAGDANSVPPTVTLMPSGPEGLVGPRSEAMIYFSTEVRGEGVEADPAAEYTKGSKVTFSCSIDGRPIRCPSEYLETEGGDGILLHSWRAPERTLPGPFDGRIPIPPNLSSGPHTVTVVASDEDGTAPNPPSAVVTFDRTPPTRPKLEVRPSRSSRRHKPVFWFSASDEVRLVRADEERIFTAKLRRLRPSPHLYREGGSDGSFEWSMFRCPTLLTCSARGRAYYWGRGNGVSTGIYERLPRGLYEFRIRARDAVGNKSPFKTYRFRILPGPERRYPYRRGTEP